MKQQEQVMDQKYMAMEKQMESRLKAIEFSQDTRHKEIEHQQKVKQIAETANAKRAAAKVQRVERKPGN